jgi:hypothetical protein
MSLTFSHIVNRLDVLNSREKQVRKFYRPLSAKERTKPPSASRHRFADVLEPGDVVKTIGKTEGWDDPSFSEDKNSLESGSSAGSVSRPPSSEHGEMRQAPGSPGISATRAVQRSHSADPSKYASRTSKSSDQNNGRPSSASSPESRFYQHIAPRIAGEVGRIEAQLFKTIEEKFLERKQLLLKQLYRDVGLTDEGFMPNPEMCSPRHDPSSMVDPLFKPTGKVLSVPKRKPDSKSHVSTCALAYVHPCMCTCTLAL